MTEQQIKLPISPAIERAIEDGQQLISYISKDGIADLPVELTQAMVEAKYQSASGEWSAEEETHFLLNYDKLAKIVFPVTIESINAIVPRQSEKDLSKTQAETAVTRYRRFAFWSLFVLLLIQLYWFIGNNLRVNLNGIFAEREAIHTKVMEIRAGDVGIEQLKSTLTLANQQLDANYELLKLWNRVLALGMQFTDKIPPYTKERLGFEDNHNPAGFDGPMVKKSAELADRDRDLYSARILYFKNILAADFFLEALQSYILPLLYGLLGAVIYVLRCLLKEIKALTFTTETEIRFRLRITLGALGGMLVGWFFKPQGAEALASLSPMAMAFLMGYNVELLFAIMDKTIDNISNTLNKTTGQAASSAPQPGQTKDTQN